MGVVEDVINWVAETLRIPYGWTLALVTAVVALALGWAVRRVVIAVGEPLARRTRTDFDDLVVRAVATPLGLTVVLFGLVAAAGLVVTGERGRSVLAHAIPTGIILIWGVALASLAGQALLRAARRTPGHGRMRGAVLLARFTKVVIGVILVLTLFSVWGISITPLVAGAGIAGIAIALAAQDSLANLFAGIAVYGDHLYEVGDWVVLDQGSSNEIRGEVTDIGLRSTRILTRDDVLIIVPNSVIANGRVVNESSGRPSYRVRVAVTVAYESDLEHVERALVRVGTAHALLLEEPGPRARVRQFRESGVLVELLGWIGDPEDRGVVVHELSKAIHRAFAKEGIRIAFPQRDVHLFAGEARTPVAGGENVAAVED